MAAGKRWEKCSFGYLNSFFQIFVRLRNGQLFVFVYVRFQSYLFFLSEGDDSGFRNLPQPTRNGLFTALFRMDPLSIQMHPAGNHTGSLKQYSGRIPSYPETGKCGKFPLPDSMQKEQESERETSRKSMFPFGTWMEKFVSQPDVS